METNWNATVPARYLLALIGYLEATGFDTRPSLARARLDAQVLRQPEARVAREALTVVLDDLVQRSNRTDLGFELGTRLNLPAAEAIGPMLLSAPTLRAGLARTAPYFSVLTPSFQEHYEESEDHDVLTCTPSRSLPYQMVVMGLETIAVATHRVLSFVTQEKSVASRLEVSWPAPAHAARYRTLKGAEVVFGAGTELAFRLRIPTSLTTAPLPMADPQAFDRAERVCHDLAGPLRARRSWTQWAELMLRSTDGDFPSQEQLAALMNVSARTLARHLLREGQTYRTLSRRVRHERALELLATSNLTVSEVGHLLGYSDASNFARAFRSIQSTSPGQHRRRLPCLAKAESGER